MNTKNKLSIAALAALTAGASYFGYNNLEGVMEERAYYQDLATRIPLEVGMKAPDFSLRSIDGREISLSKLEDKVVLLDFWATFCGPCKALTPYIKEVYDACKDDGFEVVQIAVKDKKPALDSYINKHGAPSWPLVHDSDDALWKSYQLDGIPSLFLIKNGKIEAIQGGYGSITLAWLKKIKTELKKKSNH